jgi:hypothetical protein
MKRLILFLGYGAAVLTILFALALPIKGFPIFLSALSSLNLKIAPWFSGGEVAFVIDRNSYQIKVYPSRVQEAIDLNRDGMVDCEISFSIPPGEESPLILTVNPHSPWVSPVLDSPTTSLGGVLAERVKDAIFVRVPIRKMGSS